MRAFLPARSLSTRLLLVLFLPLAGMGLFASLWAADHLNEARTAEVQRRQTTAVVASAELLFSVELAQTMVDLVVNETGGVEGLGAYRPLVDDQTALQANAIVATTKRVRDLRPVNAVEEQTLTTMSAAAAELDGVALTSGASPRLVFSHRSLRALQRASKVLERAVVDLRGQEDDINVGALLALADLQRRTLRDGSITMAFAYSSGSPLAPSRVREVAAAVTSAARTTFSIVPGDVRSKLAVLGDSADGAKWRAFQAAIIAGRPVALMDGLPTLVKRTTVIADVKVAYGRRLIAGATKTASDARRGLVIALWLGGGLFIGTLILAFATMQPATRRLRRLERQALRIGTGDLNVEPLDVAGHDETALLAQSFDLMAGTLTSLQRKMDALADGAEDLDMDAQPVPGRIGESIARSVARLSAMTSTLRLNEELARLTVDAAVEAIWILDEHLSVVSANPAAAAMSGRDPLAGGGLMDVLNLGSGSDVFASVMECTNVDGWIRRPDGTTVEVLVSTRRVAPADGTVRWMVFVRDISDRKRLEARLEMEATHDTLTGLPNRLALTRLLTRTGPTSGSPVTTLFVDLDGFKRVNDAMGHRAGDELLREAANRLRAAVRAEDTVTRLGGDEFVVVLGDGASDDDVDTMAVRLLEQLELPFHVQGTPVHLSASVGIATSVDDIDPTDVIRLADLAMYQAKQDGRGMAIRYDGSMHERVAERVELEEALRHATTNGELTPFFQPVVAVDDGRLTRIELLARWDRPGMGSVSPARFIPLAEETGMVVDIGRWALRAAAHMAVSLRAMIPDFAVPIAVNVSGMHVVRGDVVADVEAALLETGCAAQWLAIELTETYLLDEAVEQVDMALHRLVERGVGLSIDDFGTGYSSMTYLRRLPADVVKVDQSFVAALGDPGTGQGIIELIATLAHTLGMTVVAEGVETDEQLHRVREAGCDEAQGFLIARPMGADAFIDWLAAPRGHVHPTWERATAR